MHKGTSISIILITGLMTALTVVGGMIRIPAFPVAFSMQTFFVYLSGVMLPGLWAAVSQVLYIVLGLMGLPVFTAGGGPGYVLHPTFGFLAGFPLASFLISRTVRSTFDAKKYGAVFALSYLLVSIIGMGYLYCNMKWIAGTSVGWSRVIISGLVLFLPSEAVKIGVAAWLSVKLSRYRRWMHS